LSLAEGMAMLAQSGARHNGGNAIGVFAVW
jgi:hypothetical protein